MQKSMTSIDTEKSWAAAGYEVHKRKDKREEPTIHTHADAGRIEGRAAAAAPAAIKSGDCRLINATREK